MRLCIRCLAWGIALIVFPVTVSATDYTWTGGSSANGNWTTAANWSGNNVPVSNSANTLTFASNTYNFNSANNIANPPFNLFQLTFANTLPSTGIHLTGNSLAFSAAIQSGIYQNSPYTATIDNALSWSGSNPLTIGGQGTGTLILNNSLNVGYSSPAALMIQANSAVNITGELDVNYQISRGSASTVTLNSGLLTVSGQTIIGRAAMNTDPSNLSAAFYQNGGTSTFNGLVTVGYAGTATSLLDISSGKLTATRGLVIGNSGGGQGNGTMNIHGSAAVTVIGNSSDPGLVVGEDSSRSTAGTLTLSGGALNVGDATHVKDLTLGLTVGSGGGVGTLNQSGGAMTVMGDLVIGGTATLCVDSTVGAISDSFAGTSGIRRTGKGTLVVVPQTGHLASSEAVVFTHAPTLTNGILGGWAVTQANGSTNTSGDYLTTISAGGGSYKLAATSYNSTNFGVSSSSALVDVSAATTLGQDKLAYAVRVGPYNVSLNGHSLQVYSGGMIFNAGSSSGGTISGGTIAFADGVGDKPAILFAGSAADPTIPSSTISAALKTSAGLVKFGPGKLVLSGTNSALSGETLISAGTLNIQNSLALGLGGSGSPVTVVPGATLELQNNIAVGNVPLTINGTGLGGGGALRNVQDSNSLAGSLTLKSNSQINTVAGTLTLNGTIVSNTFDLTKTGSGTLALAGASTSALNGSIFVSGGTLRLQNNSALGPAGGLGATIQNGATLEIAGGYTIPAVALNISGTGASGAGAIHGTSGTSTCASPITLAATSQVNVDLNSSLTLSGAISGGNSLTKGGQGTLLLSGTNTFTGGLTVLDGILSVGSLNNVGTSGPLGAGTAPVVLGGSGTTGTILSTGSSPSSTRAFTLALNGMGNFQTNNSLTLSGAIGGSGNLLKTGNGTLTLNGANTYSGTTNITQGPQNTGTLVIDTSGSINSSSGIWVGPQTTLQVNGSTNGQLPDSGNVTLNGSSVSYAANGTVNGYGELAGGLVLGPGQSSVSVTRASGTYTPYLRFASGPALTIGATVNFSATNSQIQFQNNAALTNSILGDYAFYNTTDFATCSTTSPYVVSACSYVQSDPGESTSGTINYLPSSSVSLSQSRSFNSLKLTGGLGASLNGYALTLNSGGLLVNTTSGTSCTGGTLKGSQGGELVVNVVSSSYPFTIGSTIADNATATALVKTGAGKLTLTGTNTYTGKTYLNQGTLEFSPTTGYTYGGEIYGVNTSGSLLKTGSTTLILTGASPNYFGTTTISAGTLEVDGSLGVGSAVTVASGATLAGTGTVGGNVVLNSGGTIYMPGNGNIGGTLTANSGTVWAGTVTGKTTVSSGTLAIGDSSHQGYITANGGFEVTGSATASVGSMGGTVTGNFVDSSSATWTFSGTISGSGKSVTVNNSSAVLTLSHANTYSGGTFVTAGTLKVGSGYTSALGTGGLTVGAGGIFDLNNNDFSIPSLSGDTGGLIKDSVGSGRTLTINTTTGDFVFNGSVTDSATHVLSLTKSGSRAQTIGQINIHGTITVSGGSLTCGSLTAGTLSIGGTGAGAAAVVPEPGIFSLLLTGFAACGVLGFRRYRSLHTRIKG